MILYCNSCYNHFDSNTQPEVCPCCGRNRGFGTVRIINDDGSERTWKDEIARIRNYVKHHSYMTPEEVDQMSEIDVFNLYDVMTE